MYDHERSLVKKLEDFPFALIGVNSDKDLDKLRGTVEEKNLTWRSFQNSPEGAEESISDQWNVRGWPTVYILDAEGKIRYINPQRTANAEEALDEAITALLTEMGHEVDLSKEIEEDVDEEVSDGDSEDEESESETSEAEDTDEEDSEEEESSNEDSDAEESDDDE